MPFAWPRSAWRSRGRPQKTANTKALELVAEAEALTPTCRICWDVADETRPGGALLSPCACRGSSAHIHLECLYQWQSAQRQGPGGAHRAMHCDVCKQRYRVAPDTPGLDAVPALGSGRVRDFCALLRADPTMAVEKGVQLFLTAGALLQGGRCSVLWTRRALLMAVATVWPPLRSLATWAPELILGSTAVPALQVPLACTSCALVGAAALQVAASALAAAYAGFVFGCAQGGVQSAAWLVRAGARLAGLALGGALRLLRADALAVAVRL